MRIAKASVKNFRLLCDVEVNMEDPTTVVVGRNNSGKTSLAEIFRRFLTRNVHFSLADFSLKSYPAFWEAYGLHEGGDDIKAKAALPYIELSLTISYQGSQEDLGVLSELIIDLDISNTDACAVMRFGIGDADLSAFFPPTLEGESDDDKKTYFYKCISGQMQSCYKATVEAVDPNDPTNRKPIDFTTIQKVVRVDFIDAQRTLDEPSVGEGNVLGKIIESLFSAVAGSTEPDDQALAQKLRLAVDEVQDSVQSVFGVHLQELLPAFKLFGYPGLPDPQLMTETTFKIESLLRNHTRVRYVGTQGITLPEAQNGLGARNLIYILLKLLEFFKVYFGDPISPVVHLVFIEEPEAHLHPQMQEVFISKLKEIAAVFSKEFAEGKPWDVQFAVTTHSPHIANRAPFDSMRYFLAVTDPDPEAMCQAKVKDLKTGLKDISDDQEQFLHKYMTLTRCDLLFADKAILIEGTSERLLMPAMIQKFSASQAGAAHLLSSQYVSTIEVGGAYAHLFFPLMRFLEIRTLIVTDLDSVDKADGAACLVSEGTHTSNACIKQWCENNNVTPGELIALQSEKKIHDNVRIGYQVPESKGKPCGRSLEAAFMLANPKLFGIPDDDSAETAAWNAAKLVKKSDFALKYALEETDWSIPRYIHEGLEWLASETQCLALPPTSGGGENNG